MKTKNIPQLRFPEFKDCGEWEEKEFNNICKFTRGPFGGALKKEFFVKKGYVVYEQQHAIYGNFSSFRYFVNEEKFNELKRFSVQAGDLIMSCSGTMGKLSIVPNSFKKGIINQALLLLTPLKYDSFFIKELLELPHSQEKLLSQSAGGAIKNVVAVSEMKKIKFYLPKEFTEQQKIADCLSSLDKLIHAQSQKIEKLKNHKKGLLQKLFPQEGKNIPELRFPEFKGCEEWKEKKLESYIIESFSGGTPLVSEPAYYGGDIPFIRSAEINSKTTEKLITQKGLNNSSAQMVKKGDLLLALYGATSGEVGISKINGAINQAILCIRVSCNIQLLYQWFSHYKDALLTKFLQGGQGNLSGSIVKNFDILLPPAHREQQKIADCLSSLDELIDKHSQKLESLKAHKKGLMQGLFPCA